MPAKFPAAKLPPVKRKRIHPGTLFIIVGVAAIAAAAAIWLYNEYDDRRAAESSEVRVQTILEVIMSLSDPTSPEAGAAGQGASPGSSGTGGSSDTGAASGSGTAPGAPDAESVAPPVVDRLETGGGSGTPYVMVEREAYMGILSIPALSLNLPVNLTWSYPKLRTSPCRYSGDIESNDLVIAGHSYRSHFGNLSTLAAGDVVTFTDVEGRESRYYVSAIETVHPSDTRRVVTSPYDLTLFTCTFDSRNRVVVRCFREPEPDAGPVDDIPVEELPQDDTPQDPDDDPV